MLTIISTKMMILISTRLSFPLSNISLPSRYFYSLYQFCTSECV
jgi:hypothetical protein